MILDCFRLGRRVAVVTGVGSGLGQAIAVALAEAGADVVDVYRGTVHETAQLVRDTERRFPPVQCDPGRASPTELASIIACAVCELGSVRIQVNYAGIIRRAPALEFAEDDWDSVLRVNFKAGFFPALAAARRFVEHAPPHGGRSRGKIINVASMLSFQGGLRTTSYIASKTGLIGLTRVLANEWAPQRITVNAIAPGYFATSTNRSSTTLSATRRSFLASRPVAGNSLPTSRVPPSYPPRAPGTTSTLRSYQIDGGWFAR